MSAVVDVRANTSRQLDVKKQPDEVLTETDVQDPLKLSRLLMRILSQLSELRRRYAARHNTYFNIISDGDALAPHVVRLPHGFSGPVEWHVVGVRDGVFIVDDRVVESSASDENTLVLEIFFRATIQIRVQEKGG